MKELKPTRHGQGPERYEARARLFKALGHPSRLAMLDALRRGERCVCELQELVGSDMSTVSKHLSLLREVGAVSCTRRGNNAYYRLELSCLPGFLECAESFLRKDLGARLASLA